MKSNGKKALTKKTDETLAKFDDYLRYGTDEERPKSKKTRSVYGYTARLFLEFLAGRAVTPELGKEFIRDLEARGNQPKSINLHIWALKSFFRFRRKKLNIRGLSVQEKLPRVLSLSERDRLLAMASAPLYDPKSTEYKKERTKLELALLYVYIGGGVRLSEGVRIKVDDVLDDGYLRVMGKGGKESFVPVEDEVIRIIKEYLETHKVNGYVFPGREKGTHMAPRTAQGIIKEVCRRAGLDDIRVHTLRHCLGTDLRRLGVDERDIQDILRHKNIQTTKIYTTLAKEDLRQRLPKRLPRQANASQGTLIP